MFSAILESIPWYTWVIGGLVLLLVSAAIWFYLRLSAQQASIGKLYEFAHIVNGAMVDPHMQFQGAPMMQQGGQQQQNQQQFYPSQPPSPFQPQPPMFANQTPSSDMGQGGFSQASPAAAAATADNTAAPPFDLGAIGNTLMSTIKGFMGGASQSANSNTAPQRGQDEDDAEEYYEDEEGGDEEYEYEEGEFDHQEF